MNIVFEVFKALFLEPWCWRHSEPIDAWQYYCNRVIIVVLCLLFPQILKFWRLIWENMGKKEKRVLFVWDFLFGAYVKLNPPQKILRWFLYTKCIIFWNSINPNCWPTFFLPFLRKVSRTAPVCILIVYLKHTPLIFYDILVKFLLN